MSIKSNESDRPVFTAADFVAYQRNRGLLPKIEPPRSVILIFQDHLINYAVRKHAVKQVKIFNADLYLFKEAGYQVGMISGFGTGSSATAALVDQLAAFGIQRFIAIGLAGGLQPDQQQGHLVISGQAICDEGVSRHYLSPADGSSHRVESSEEMAEGVSAILERQDHTYSFGPTWTTDAPFRELRKDALAYQNMGVLAVDMEAAAIFSVAKANGLPALAVFSLADNLANGIWEMPQDLRSAKMGLNILFDAVLEYLNGS